MLGILRLAYKLLVNDKAKLTALLIGITFAVFGMMFATSMFIGVLHHASSTVINIGSSMWVMDPAVQTIANSIGMPDYVLDTVRSMHGVKYAVLSIPAVPQFGSRTATINRSRSSDWTIQAC